MFKVRRKIREKKDEKNGVIYFKFRRVLAMKNLANPEAVMWLGVGIMITIGVISSAIIYLCM